MSTPDQPQRSYPKIGMRNIKTAIAAALCALVYFFLDRSPAFACIGAIFGMGSDLETSKLHGGNRLFGTVIGGLLGIALFRVYLIFYPEGGRSLLLVPLVFLGTVLLILLCQIFWVGGVQPGGVVLCILLFNTPVDSYVSYALNRIFDTGIGVVAALFVNSLFPGGFTFRRVEACYLHMEEELEEHRLEKEREQAARDGEEQTPQGGPA
ncbi:aromatic acid exporter family protein [uncultured Oscillibacter sp.]|uniref:FUSC family protein n=1 Tax=uncultured Oscillibacter sp. TaxID=876091 RepID=UPI0025D8E868|nr:aromatic acid exporter family protein [uncultured Oscillibacter sp.]